ncbi:MAG: hypothetical protein CEE38_16540 [Planctomycetes bacterium B3_Pla]|nr:MAG: hypothetical protein CEE38_16540 [Planctomycetes bacterium B3_Pla]
MHSIERRIGKLEKTMSVGKERKIHECVITLAEGEDLLDERQSLGPEETWLTYEEQLVAAREDQADYDHRLLMISLSVERELEARQFENSPFAEAKRAERIQEHRTAMRERSQVAPGLW